MKKALIIGSNGQDGRLLSAYLQRQQYTVLGIAKTATTCSDATTWPLVNILDSNAIADVIKQFSPDEIYYLAAFHHAAESKALINPGALWSDSLQVNVSGLIQVLEAVRLQQKPSKVFYASSCLIYGCTKEAPQTEQTPFAPDDIYGIAKMTGMQVCHYYKNHHQLFVAAGILYNHESSLRPEHFLSQKIIQGALRIKRGESQELHIGDLTTEIDWGYAPNFVEAMHAILQLPAADDFIIATGQLHSIRDFVQHAFSTLGLDWTHYVKENKAITHRRRGKLQGNITKVQQMTGWKPSVSFERMIENMLKGICLP